MDTQKVYITQIAELFPRQGEWTEYHYFALPETNRIIELSEGMLLVSPGPTLRHQKIAARLHALIDAFVSEHNLGIAVIAPFDVRLRPNEVRQPDVLFIHSDNLSRVRDGRYLDGPPDWVAEVISPGSRETDEVIKLAGYALAGVPEYWLLDPENDSIRVYRLDGKAYRLAETVTGGQTAQSAVIVGFEVTADMIFAESRD